MRFYGIQQGILACVFFSCIRAFSASDITPRADHFIDVPQHYVETPLSPARQKHYQALRLYAKGKILENKRQWAEALRVYEQALEADPQAVAILKTMIPLCYRLERESYALECCRRALNLDPNDYELAFRYSQEIREKGRKSEALAVLQKAVQVQTAKSRPAVYAQMLFSLATLQEELNQPAAAASTYEQVVLLLDQPDLLLTDPASVERKQIKEEAAKTYERLGQVRLKAGQYKEALLAFQAAQARAPERAASLLLRMSDVFTAAQQPEQALHYLRLYLRTQPMETEAYEKLIVLLEKMNRAAEILPELDQAVQRDSFNQSLKLLYARQLLRRGQAEQAEQLLVRIMSESPSEEAYRILAQWWVQQSKWTELLQRLDNDLAEVPRASLARLQLEVIAKDRVLVHGLALTATKRLQQGPPLALRTRQLLASLSRQAKLFELAEPLYQSLLKDDPLAAEVYVELIRLYGESEQYEKIQAVCRQALAQKTGLPSLVFQLELARAHSMLGQFQTSVTLAEKMVRQTAPSSREHLQAGITLLLIRYRAGEYPQAVEWGQELLEQHNEPVAQRSIRHILSGVYSAMQEYDQAQKHLEDLLAADPDDPILCNDLGYLWAEQGKNLEQAEKLIRKAIELDRADRIKLRSPLDHPGPIPDNGAYLDSLGWVLFKQGKVNEALTILKQALATPNGNDPTIHAHLAEVLEHLGEVQMAFDCLQKAHALYLTPKYRGMHAKRVEVEKQLKRIEIMRASGKR